MKWTMERQDISSDLKWLYGFRMFDAEEREFHDSVAQQENEHQSVKEPHHALAWALPQHTVTDTITK